jgi:hypothetical protein
VAHCSPAVYLKATGVWGGNVNGFRMDGVLVNVGAGDLGGQRGEVPPFGAFTMALSSEDHFHWMPRLRS